MKRTIEGILLSISIFLMSWLALSYVNVVTNNMENGKYAEWNLFRVFLSEAKEKRPISLPKKELKEQGIKVPTKLYTRENVLLLAKLIHAENGSAKHDETLWLTGAVVLKRVKAKSYPNTIRGVIFQRGQYSTASKLDSVTPSTRSMEIANDLLIYGVEDLPNNLVFQSMFPQGRKTYKVIDGEYFCLA